MLRSGFGSGEEVEVFSIIFSITFIDCIELCEFSVKKCLRNSCYSAKRKIMYRRLFVRAIFIGARSFGIAIITSETSQLSQLQYEMVAVMLFLTAVQYNFILNNFFLRFVFEIQANDIRAEGRVLQKSDKTVVVHTAYVNNEGCSHTTRATIIDDDGDKENVLDEEEKIRAR